MDRINLQVIRESFGRVAYSHKTHEKDAEIESHQAMKIRWMNIILTTITSGALVSTIITNQTILIYISAVFSSLTLAFTVFQLSFNPEKSAEKHRRAAKDLWYIRERHVNLIADIMSGRLSNQEISHQRGKLTKELSFVYKSTPITSPKAYDRARQALKIKEELTFSDEEIDQMLPGELKMKK